MKGATATAATVGVVALAVICSLAIGSVVVPVGDVGEFLAGNGGPSGGILQGRVSRTVVAVVVGAALAVSGVVLQGVTRNPLADPGLLGINSGAALAVVTGMVTGVGASQPVIVVLALGGALSAAAFVFLLNRRAGGSPVTMVLLGAAVSAGCASLTSALAIGNQDALDVMRFWQVGSVGGRELGLLLPALPPLLVGAAMTLWAGSTLNAFAVGDDLASALGTRVGRARVVLTLGAVLLAAGSVSVAGPVAFAGLVVPHAARLLFGVDHRVVLPACLALGPTFLLLADTLGRVISPPAEIAAGLVVLVVGAPVLVFLVRRAVRA